IIKYMGLYERYWLPKAMDSSCRKESIMQQRNKVIPHAQGSVIEVGIGSGLNLPFYRKEKVKHLTAIDPSEDNWKKNTVDISNLPYDFQFIKGFAESIPIESKSFDTVVLTYTLCTISNFQEALSEMRRVLKSSGTLLFCEHGKAPEKVVQHWQNLINPFWKILGGGCNLNRDIPQIIEDNGFKISKMDTMYIHDWKPGGFNYWGRAEIK
ncbi:MAG: class I SAM-dependent methyltransferase, partial [Desulfobacterales bacterium]|nr:class I SAM-dependent methyltransferase [Desulfobacterales bacterium]